MILSVFNRWLFILQCTNKADRRRDGEKARLKVGRKYLIYELSV